MEEVKHYMHGLTQLHLSRGVAYRVKMAEDVLFNEVRITIYFLCDNDLIIDIIIGNGLHTPKEVLYRV